MSTTVILYGHASGRSPIQDFLDSLAPKDRAKCYVFIKWFLQEHDWSKGPPPSSFSKHLRGRIYELRPASQGVEYRLLYARASDGTLVVLNALKKKRQAMPLAEIQLAEQRLGEVEEAIERRRRNDANA